MSTSGTARRVPHWPWCVLPLNGLMCARVAGSVDMVEVMHLMSRMAETASEDDQTVREAVRDAMFLYLSLPQSARRALRALSAIGGDEEREAIAQAAASAIVRAGFMPPAGRALPEPVWLIRTASSRPRKTSRRKRCGSQALHTQASVDLP